MTKEDKQIIDRAIKENWRIGDRSRLKRLLKKNLELYRENAELKEQNSHLYNDLTMTEAENAGQKDQLTKATEIIREFMKYEINEYDGSLEIHFEELKKQAEQFIKEIEK